MRLSGEAYAIEIKKDPKFKMDGEDNAPYDICLDPFSHYSPDGFYACLSIHIVGKNRTTRLALVCNYYSTDRNCALLENDVLTLLCNDAVVQLDLTSISLRSCRKLDTLGCNFGIYKVPDGYIIHGETEIEKLDESLNKLWEFSGIDIFVSITGREAFSFGENSIRLYDFEDNFYEIDLQGNLIREELVKR